MSERNSYSRRRRSRFQGQGTSQNPFYVYGNTIRSTQALPKRSMRTDPRYIRHASRQVKRNRNRAMNISLPYAIFLAVAAVCIVVICMMYLELQSDVMNRSENVISMQQQLSELTEANNAAYNAAVDSVNLETVHEKAMNEMGMVYDSDGTVIEYDSPSGEYVRQYKDIPEDGISAE